MVLHSKWVAATCLRLSLATFFLGLLAQPRVQAAEIKFKKVKIELNSAAGQATKKTITVDLAETPDQLEQGLMFRTKLPPDGGMLFVFAEESPREFWMKNTLIPLDIGFFSKGRVLVDIQQMKEVSTVMQTDLPIYASKAPAQYALEMPAHWFKKNHIREGATFKILKKF